MHSNKTPNHALQRTALGGDGRPAIHAYLRPKRSLSLGPFGNPMNLALRVLTIPALLWAILPPAIFGLLFLVGARGHWSVLFDLIVSSSCIVLAFSVFRKIPKGVWLCAFLVVGSTTVAELFHTFDDYESSGPRPFEWINGYFFRGLPLLTIVSIVNLLSQTPPAEQAGAADRAGRGR
jgi:hypothetical protein